MFLRKIFTNAVSDTVPKADGHIFVTHGFLAVFLSLPLSTIANVSIPDSQPSPAQHPQGLFNHIEWRSVAQPIG